jgi:hypothetical protein
MLLGSNRLEIRKIGQIEAMALFDVVRYTLKYTFTLVSTIVNFVLILATIRSKFAFYLVIKILHAILGSSTPQHSVSRWRLLCLADANGASDPSGDHSCVANCDDEELLFRIVNAHIWSRMLIDVPVDHCRRPVLPRIFTIFVRNFIFNNFNN